MANRTSRADDGSRELLRRLSGIEGWLHEDEALETFRSARDLEPRDGGLTIVEIGSWKGRSTIVLATALELSGHDGRVIAIDPHTGNVEHVRRWREVDTFEEFLANLDRAGVRGRVEPRRASSHEAHVGVPDESVDLLFIDGSHEYEDVVADIDLWSSKLRAPATVIFNDSSWPGVYRALRERVVRRDAPYRHPRLVRSTLFVRYDPRSSPAAGERREWVSARIVLCSRAAAHRIVPRLPRWAKEAGNRLTARLTSRRRA